MLAQECSAELPAHELPVLQSDCAPPPRGFPEWNAVQVGVHRPAVAAFPVAVVARSARPDR
ncbi:Uncharacterised protein [Shigella sonnei]|nr:Uncharacterised protein [Shigella sonnei]